MAGRWPRGRLLNAVVRMAAVSGEAAAVQPAQEAAPQDDVPEWLRKAPMYTKDPVGAARALRPVIEQQFYDHWPRVQLLISRQIMFF